MTISSQYAAVLDALEVLQECIFESVDKSYIEEILVNVYKEVITAGTLNCKTNAVTYTFIDSSVLTFNRGERPWTSFLRTFMQTLNVTSLDINDRRTGNSVWNELNLSHAIRQPKANGRTKRKNNIF